MSESGPQDSGVALGPLDHSLDTETVRRMSAEEKLAVMHGLIRQAWELKAAVIRSREPELPEDEVRRRAWKMVAGERP